MRTLLTEVLNNFTVNNKFVNDKFIIGNGQEEIITLKFSNNENSAGIRYTQNGLEFSNDGIIWNSFDSSSTINYEPIEFTESNLDSNGKLHIQHNFNNKNILCLGYSIMPKDIEYQDNEIIFDYSDQSTISGAIWFINSTQDMLESQQTLPEYDSSLSAINVSYTGNQTGQQFNFKLFNNGNANFQNIEKPDYVVDKCFCEGTCCIDTGSPVIIVGDNFNTSEKATKTKLFIQCGDAILAEFCVIGYIEDLDGIKFNKEYEVHIDQGCSADTTKYPKTIILSPAE